MLNKDISLLEKEDTNSCLTA